MSTNEKQIENSEPLLLCTLPDDIQANMLIATLKERGIPVMKKTQGATQVLNIVMGFTYQDIEIYVPSNLLNDAEEVLTVIFGSEVTEAAEVADEEEFDEENEE